MLPGDFGAAQENTEKVEGTPRRYDEDRAKERDRAVTRGRNAWFKVSKKAIQEADAHFSLPISRNRFRIGDSPASARSRSTSCALR